MPRRVITFAIAIGLAADMTAGAAADQACKPVIGSFEAHVVPAPDCTAPFCTAGRVWGGLQGQYEFSMLTPPQPSGAVPSIFFFTGNSTVTLKSGEIVYGTDTGSLDFGPNGGFASLITFYDPANPAVNRGQIRLRGELNQTEGTTSGDYIGTICH